MRSKKQAVREHEKFTKALASVLSASQEQIRASREEVKVAGNLIAGHTVAAVAEHPQCDQPYIKRQR